MLKIARHHILLTVLILILAGCTSDDATPTSATPVAAPQTTTSTFPATTTTTLPSGEVSVATSDDVPGNLLDQVAAIYYIASYGSGEAVSAARPTLDAPVELIRHLETLADSSEPEIALEADIASSAIGEEYGAVISVGEDVLFAVSSDNESWRIIGTKLTSVGDSPWYGTEPRQLFIIGSDARPGENPQKLRADSLHIISMVPDGSAISIVGIPRDSYVTTPEGGRRKFTNIMAGNGPDRIVATAEILTELEFDGYVLTGFAGFVALVNDFGGITVDIPFAMNEPKSQAYFSAGEQFVNGAQALAFARNRTLSGGDFTRQFHHGVIMQWGIAAMQGKGVMALPESLGILAEHTFTDLDAETMMLVGAALFEQEPFEIPNLVLPGSPGWAGEASVVYLAEERSQEIFTDIADGTFDTYVAP